MKRLLFIGLMLTLTRAGFAQALKADALFPSGDSTGICPDTTLRIRFAKSVVLGSSGKIQIIDTADNEVVDSIDLTATASGLGPTSAPAAVRMSASLGAPTRVRTIGGLANYNCYPVIITDNQAEIFPASGALNYNKTYSVSIDAGVFKEGDASLAPMSWNFSTRAQAPRAGLEKITVARDSSGDFSTLQGALDSISAGNMTPTTITLRKGIYTELIYFTNKNAITIAGEDRKQTIINYATNDRFNNSAGGGGYRRGVFRANRCNDLTLTNLTIRNTTPQGGTQAETIILNGTPTSRAILTKLDLYSYQDTLQVNGQAYINDCFIEGDVDFMWGNGPCFFENCTARTVRNNAYYTQIRNPATNHGYIYYKCIFEGAPGITGNLLSRIAPATFPYSEVVLIDCVTTGAVAPVGWRLDQAANAPNTSNLHFWEFNSHTADGTPADVSQRLNVSKQLKQPEDAKVIADYSDPAFVLGNGWNPREAMKAVKP